MSKKITRAKIKAFQKQVYAHYGASGRHTLPWRHTADPYHILVSEVMLQQTQVDRVIPKYKAFLQQFPTPTALAEAPLAAVLQLWVGLGYNRRARFLHEAAKVVVQQGMFPDTEDGLRKLPGVGSYTAAAVAAFAYNAPVVLIETNLRTVFIHHFYNDATHAVTDTELLSIIAATLDRVQPRIWYYALMDYGAHLKRVVGNHRTKSAVYKKQSSFKGSNRQVRGYIIRSLTDVRCPLSVEKLLKRASFPLEKEMLIQQLQALHKEGMLEKVPGGYCLVT